MFRKWRVAWSRWSYSCKTMYENCHSNTEMCKGWQTGHRDWTSPIAGPRVVDYIIIANAALRRSAADPLSTVEKWSASCWLFLFLWLEGVFCGQLTAVCLELSRSHGHEEHLRVLPFLHRVPYYHHWTRRLVHRWIPARRDLRFQLPERGQYPVVPDFWRARAILRGSQYWHWSSAVRESHYT